MNIRFSPAVKLSFGVLTLTLSTLIVGKWLGILQIVEGSFAPFLAFVSCTGFIAYLLFLKRTMRDLDPGKVVPERVKAAFNALGEGILILDEHGFIVLANTAFTLGSDEITSDLVGTKASDMNWTLHDSKENNLEENLPWTRVLNSGESSTRERLTRHLGEKNQCSYAVNCKPIQDDEKLVRGVIATFSDLTELERNNEKLQDAVSALKQSKTAVDLKSKELELLATRDPLTNCLNRRAFNEQYLHFFNNAVESNTPLVCLMIDIDHFKRVNDSYGHSVGDKVIKFVADTLRTKIRQRDLLARYGGEEFCLILDGSTLEQATVVAERMRLAIKNGDPRRFTSALHITASFGLASVNAELVDKDALINNADRALYLAKESGRNKVMIWDGEHAGYSVTAEPVERGKTTADESLKEPGDAPPTPVSQSDVRARIEELEKIAQDKAEQLDRFFTYDALTDLPMRYLFIDRVDQALLQAKRRSCVLAVLSLGLADFRRINDTLGHECAEEMLRETATRLREILRAEDTVSLLGSENKEIAISKLNDGEFGILLSSAKDNESITWIVSRIFDALSEPFYVDGHSMSISSNIGIGLYPADDLDAQGLIKKASVARYYAEQQSGHNVVEYFSEQVNQISKDQLHLESQLAEALENNEFEILYQPKINLFSGLICGFESLLRWRHPTRGLLIPADFIKITERTGQINLIGDWVLRESCAQLILFDQQTNARPTVAVNLSAVQLTQVDLADRILEVLEQTGLAADRLELEITASCLMENMDVAFETLSSLRARDVKISIDDFGTGYSGLSYLHTLPVDILKIDRCFVADIDSNSHDNAIIDAIIKMAKTLKLRVTAEGVETLQQREKLLEMDCDEAQGYLFSRPVPADDATDLIKTQGFQH